MKIKFLTVFCLSTLCLAGCGRSSSERSLLSFVPSSSYAVLAVNWRTVGKDSELSRIAKGAAIEKLFNELGVGSESVTEFAVFGNPQNSPTAGNGLIAKGSFDTRKIVQGLKNRGWQEQNLDGRPAYVSPTDGSYLTTFDTNLFVLGTPAGVRGAINAKAKPEMRFTSNPAYKTLSSRFEGKRYPIVMMVAFPQESQDMANAALQISSTVMSLAGVGPLGDLLNKIGYAQGLGCAISRDNNSFPVEVSAVMKDEDSAKFVSGTLNLLKSVAAMAPKTNTSQRDMEVAHTLQSLSIQRSREILSIRMIMARSDLLGMNP